MRLVTQREVQPPGAMPTTHLRTLTDESIGNEFANGHSNGSGVTIPIQITGRLPHKSVSPRPVRVTPSLGCVSPSCDSFSPGHKPILNGRRDSYDLIDADLKEEDIDVTVANTGQKKTTDRIQELLKEHLDEVSNALMASHKQTVGRIVKILDFMGTAADLSELRAENERLKASLKATGPRISAHIDAETSSTEEDVSSKKTPAKIPEESPYNRKRRRKNSIFSTSSAVDRIVQFTGLRGNGSVLHSNSDMPEPHFCRTSREAWGVEKPGSREAGGNERDSLRYSCKTSITPTPRHSWLSRPSTGESDRDGRSMFADPQAMKEQIRKSIVHKNYNVFDYYRSEGWCQRVAKSPIFEQITFFIIIVNAIWIAVDTDNNKASILLRAAPEFLVAENFFCSFFAFEWYVRMRAFREWSFAARDPWFMFDSVLLAMFVLEVWVLTLVIAVIDPGGQVDKAGDASILRIFRVLRLSRMARVARLFRLIPELMIMLKGMMVACRSVGVTLGLLTLILYIFAIAFTQLLQGTFSGSVYFQTVPQSMASLVAYGIIMEDTPEVLQVLAKESIIYYWLLLCFILLASFTVLNMLVGVMCETVRVVATVENEQITVSYAKDRLMAMLETSGLDEDNDKQISKNEFNNLLSLPDAVRTLHHLGVDVVGLVDLSDFIFDEENNALPFHDFMEVVLQLRGSNHATVKDMVDFRKCLQKELSDIRDALQDICPDMSRKKRLSSPSPAFKGFSFFDTDAVEQKLGSRWTSARPGTTGSTGSAIRRGIAEGSVWY